MSLGEMLADSTVTGTPPFFLPQTPAGSAAAAAAATRALIMNPAAAAYLAASGAGAAPFLYGNNALRYSCNNITTTLIQISRLFYFGFFSKTNHQMII